MKGFTLLETLTVIFILGFIAGLFIVFIINLFNYNVFFVFNLGGTRDVDLTLNNIMKELRSMIPSDNGVYPIEEAYQNKITFYSDIDGDGSAERIRYFLEGSDLKRGVIKARQRQYYPEDEKIWTMIRNVSKFEIYYYDSNYTGNEDPLPFPVDVSKIRVIKVNVAIKFLNKPEINYYIIATPRNFRGKWIKKLKSHYMYWFIAE